MQNANERPKLYVVERDPHVCSLIERFLGGDYTLETFSSGYVALDRTRLFPPAVLITEILIAELDGLTLCRLLKSDGVTQHVPILVLSMLASGERAMLSGANAFLQKPIERNRLLTAVRGLTPSPAEQRTGSSRNESAPVTRRRTSSSAAASRRTRSTSSWDNLVRGRQSSPSSSCSRTRATTGRSST